MNAVCHGDDWCSWNASKDQQSAAAALQSWVKAARHLTDVWCSLNPSLKYYSFFSARHITFSRIDLLFNSPQLLRNINNASLLPIALSDHKGAFCNATPGCLCLVPYRFGTTCRGHTERANFSIFRASSEEVLRRLFCFVSCVHTESAKRPSNNSPPMAALYVLWWS